MIIKIPMFLVGVIATIFAEMVVLMIVTIRMGRKK